MTMQLKQIEFCKQTNSEKAMLDRECYAAINKLKMYNPILDTDKFSYLTFLLKRANSLCVAGRSTESSRRVLIKVIEDIEAVYEDRMEKSKKFQRQIVKEYAVRKPLVEKDMIVKETYEEAEKRYGEKIHLIKTRLVDAIELIASTTSPITKNEIKETIILRNTLKILVRNFTKSFDLKKVNKKTKMLIQDCLGLFLKYDQRAIVKLACAKQTIFI